MKLNKQEYAQAKLGELKPHPRNPRQGDVGAIYQSIEANGFYGAIVAQRSTGYILAGNHRYKAAVEAGAKSVPVIWVDVDDETAVRVLLADNRTNDVASYDNAVLAEILTELANGPGLEGTGYDGDDLDQLLTSLAGDVDQQSNELSRNSLSDKFGIPPFSVLNAREGGWQERKRCWLALGIKSELGRGAPIGGALLPMDRQKGGSASPGGSMMPAADCGRSKARGDGRGRAVRLNYGRTFGQDLMRGEHVVGGK